MYLSTPRATSPGLRPQPPHGTQTKAVAPAQGVRTDELILPRFLDPVCGMKPCQGATAVRADSVASRTWWELDSIKTNESIFKPREPLNFPVSREHHKEDPGGAQKPECCLCRPTRTHWVLECDIGP